MVWVRVPVWQSSLTQQSCHDETPILASTGPWLSRYTAASDKAQHHRAPACPSSLSSHHFDLTWPCDAFFFSSFWSPMQCQPHHNLLGYQRMSARVLRVFSRQLELALPQLMPSSGYPVLLTSEHPLYPGSSLHAGATEAIQEVLLRRHALAHLCNWLVSILCWRSRCPLRYSPCSLHKCWLMEATRPPAIALGALSNHTGA